MDWLFDFQRSFREPVYLFLGTYWPVIASVVLMALGWFVASLTRSHRVTTAEAASDADDAGDGT